MEMIEGSKLVYEYKKYGEDGEVESITRAVDGVDLDVKRGDFVAILGHNGSGKSTLAKHINAILIPSEGTLYVDGKDTSKEENIWDVRQSAGMVFQNPDNQIIGTVVEEDVGFGPENMGTPTDEIWERVEKSLKAVGMWEYRKKSPNRLSGGQKQRVAIAGVIAMEPACIVLDESTAMLDPMGRREVLETVQKLNREKGITIVLITHHMDEAAMADRIVVMDGGSVVMDGPPKEILVRVEELRAIGLAAPHTVELLYGLRQDGFDVPLDALGIQACADAIAAGLRK